VIIYDQDPQGRLVPITCCGVWLHALTIAQAGLVRIGDIASLAPPQRRVAGLSSPAGYPSPSHGSQLAEYGALMAAAPSGAAPGRKPG